MTTRVGILVFDGFDLLDVGGPYEVFLTATRLAERDGKPPSFSIDLLSPTGADVTAYGGMTLTKLAPVTSDSRYDVVVIPGLIDIERGVADRRLGAAVNSLTSQSGLTTSVCTGAFLLAQQGILDGLPATTHWEDVDGLRQAGIADAVAGVRWVDAGSVVTGGALTSGLHMALHLVARLAGEEMAQRTARQLDMDWSPDPAR